MSLDASHALDDRPSHDATRTAILDAARALLVSDGPDGLTVRRIAGEAGHSTMAVYSRFGGKDGIVDVLVAEGFGLLTSTLEATIRTIHAGAGDRAGGGDADAGPLAEVYRMGTAYRRFAHEHPQHYRLMFDRPVPGYEPSPETAAIADGALGVLVGSLDRAMRAGALAHGDPAVTAVTVWATAHGLVSLELAGSASPVVEWDVVHDHTWSVLFAGLATPR